MLAGEREGVCGGERGLGRVGWAVRGDIWGVDY